MILLGILLTEDLVRQLKGQLEEIIDRKYTTF